MLYHGVRIQSSQSTATTTSPEWRLQTLSDDNRTDTDGMVGTQQQQQQKSDNK